MKGEVQTINGKRIATPEYRAWQAMKNRCINPHAQDYSYYGGRDIRVCKRWLIFDNFLADMGRRPTPLHTLERKNVNGHYSKRNCVWAERWLQSRNRTDTRFSQKKADRVRALYATGRYFQYEIAAMFGSTQAAISQITRNAAWVDRTGGGR